MFDAQDYLRAAAVSKGGEKRYEEVFQMASRWYAN